MKVRTSLLIFGLPAYPMYAAIPIAFTLGSLIGGTTYFLVAAIVLALLIKHTAHRDGKQLVWSYDAIFDMKIIVDGLPHDFLKNTELFIENGNRIVFSIPNNETLKRALKLFVSERLGVCRFEITDDASVRAEPLDNDVFIIRARSFDKVEREMGVMLKRGWKIDGEASIHTGLLDAVYIQRMIFNQ